MARQENINKAVELVDRLRDLTEEQKLELKQRIPEAAAGVEEALTQIILFPYNFHDREIFSEIFLLIFKR